MEETAVIILKLPPACLSPNRPPFTRGGRFAKAAATKKQRDEARKAIIDARIESGPWDKVEVKAVFYHKVNRRRDGSNFNAMLKGCFDGLIDGGIAIDDNHTCWTTMPPEFRIDKENPRVEVTVTRVK